MGRTKKVCVAFAIGCPRMQTDTAWLFSYFQANGCKMVKNAAAADLIVVATCGFAAHIEAESIRLLSLLEKKRRHGSQLVVVGCLAGINPDSVLSRFDATVIRPADIHQLDEMIGATVPLQSVPPVNCVEPRLAAACACWTVREVYPNMGTWSVIKRQAKMAFFGVLSHLGTERFAMRTTRRFSRKSKGSLADPTFYIRIARGCLEECTYCAIRFAAGTLRSKPLEDVLAEFDRGLAQKHQNFELLAEDVGSYGLDNGSNCVKLFEGLFSRRGPYKLIITDVNIRYLIRFGPGLSDLFADHADRIRQLKVPVQSGSDRILRRMKRCYTSAQARAALSYLRDKAPTLPLETHVLVGFPGETDGDFEDTLNLLRAVRFETICVYRYTDRPGTDASAMTDKVPMHIQKERIRRLVSEFPQARVSTIDDNEEEDEGGTWKPTEAVTPVESCRETDRLPQPSMAFDMRPMGNAEPSEGMC